MLATAPGDIVALAFIGKSNQPLLVRTFVDSADEDAVARLQLIIHSSLDAIEEKERRADMYLGHLALIDEFQTFGYLTMTGVKLAVVVRDSATVKEGELKALLQRLHRAFVAHLQNPFAPLRGDPASPKLNAAINREIEMIARQQS